jgi:putative endonuclease
MIKAAGAGRRQEAERRGRIAETAAALFLRAKGYRILARRYRTSAGEIDLVARRRGHLAFVEVKARRFMADALSAIQVRQRQRIARAAEAFLAGHPEFVGDEVSFDAIFVAPWKLPVHIPAAWHIMAP